MAHGSATLESPIYTSPHLETKGTPRREAKETRHDADEVLMQDIAIGIEKDHAPILRVQGIDLARMTGTRLMEAMESLFSS